MSIEYLYMIKIIIVFRLFIRRYIYLRVIYMVYIVEFVFCKEIVIDYL